MGPIRTTVLAALFGMTAAIPVLAQDRAATLADLRAQLSALAAELQSLRSELVAGGQPAIQAAGGASALDRMNAMEGQIARLTAEVEQLNNRVARIVADATNRIGDLEFRICELEEGCDPSSLPITASLGGGGGGPAAGPAAVPQAPTGSGPELAVAEKEDFERAQAALEAGDYQAAADQFARFVEAYPVGPLTSDAHFLRGEALQKLGDTANAARAYLNAFSGAPNGPRAPAALLKLGAALGVLGQVQEACVTLGEVGTRFPTSAEAVEAGTAMRALNCP